MGQDISKVIGEEGSQTVKAWRTSRETQGLDGRTGRGATMTPIQIKTAIKVHQMAGEKTEDYDILASEMDLDIEADAIGIITCDSPTGSRQIISKFNVKHEYVPLTFSDLMTPLGGGKDEDCSDRCLQSKFQNSQDHQKSAQKKAEEKPDQFEQKEMINVKVLDCSSSFCSDSSSDMDELDEA